MTQLIGDAFLNMPLHFFYLKGSQKWGQISLKTDMQNLADKDIKIITEATSPELAKLKIEIKDAKILENASHINLIAKRKACASLTEAATKLAQEGQKKRLDLLPEAELKAKELETECSTLATKSASYSAAFVAKSTEIGQLSDSITEDIALQSEAKKNQEEIARLIDAIRAKIRAFRSDSISAEEKLAQTEQRLTQTIAYFRG